jgi:hypothetical protein
MRMEKWIRKKVPDWLKSAWSYVGVDDYVAVFFFVVRGAGIFQRVYPLYSKIE